jgi:hypothetical protein
MRTVPGVQQMSIDRSGIHGEGDDIEMTEQECVESGCQQYE